MLAGLTVYIISKEFGITSVKDVLKSVNLWFLIPAVICMLMFSVGEALNIRLGLRLSGYKIKVSHASFSLLLELIGYEVASISIAFVGVIVSLVSPLKLFEGLSIGWVLILGFLVNFALLTGLLLIMYSKRAVKVIAGIAIKLGSIFSKKNSSVV